MAEKNPESGAGFSPPSKTPPDRAGDCAGDRERGRMIIGAHSRATATAEKKLTPAARRALREAAARRAEAGNGAQPKETGGPKGEEPTRFGDWERSGRAVDF